MEESFWDLLGINAKDHTLPTEGFFVENNLLCDQSVLAFFNNDVESLGAQCQGKCASVYFNAILFVCGLIMYSFSSCAVAATLAQLHDRILRLGPLLVFAQGLCESSSMHVSISL